MSGVELRGCRISSATPAALLAYECALAAQLGWRSGVDMTLAQALQGAPGFVMAHVLQAYLLVAAAIHAESDRCAPRACPPVNAIALHLATIGAALDDDD